MLSTAVINCTSGKGGFTFIDSSSITVRGLTFLTCGTVSYGDIDIGEPISLTPYAAVFAMNVSLFLFHQNSIQDIIDGFGLLVYQCDVVKVRNCSFYHSPWPHVQLDDMEFPEYDRGTTGFIWYSFANSVRLEFSNSNFTKCLINSFDYHGHVFLSYSQSKQLLQADFSHLTFYQNTAVFSNKELFDGICAFICARFSFNNRRASLQITNSIFAQSEMRALSIVAMQESALDLILLENQFLNNSHSNLFLICSSIQAQCT